MSRKSLTSLALIVVLALAGSLFAEDGFKPIFDGRTLDGWKAPNMSYWSVQDGAITGQSTEQNPVRSNQFLVWQLGQIDDFELKLQFKLEGTNAANSGVQIRSQVHPDGSVGGYQPDIDRAGTYVGAIYDERGRGMLAERGQKTLITADGKMNKSSFADSAELFKSIDMSTWNQVHITAQGPHLTVRINGNITSEVIDLDEKNRDLIGCLALQLHAGPPMKVQFKDIQLKRLKMAENKKIVLIAGPQSHGYNGHEHNAGCLLLEKYLNASNTGVVATTYRSGWPKDPTAFDNADAVCVFSDGGGGHPVMRHLDEMDALAAKGVGVAMLHYAVEVPKGGAGDLMVKWTGGYFETFWSVNPHWKAEFKQFPDHPVARGLKPFAIDDEWYYHMRFPDDMKNVTPILTAVPPDSTRERPDDAHGGNPTVRARKGMPEHLAWVIERPDGGRGFGFTGGHWHHNWAEPNFRTVVLNALVWVAGKDVPEGGVPSWTPSIDELKANQDYEQPGNFNWDRIKAQIDEWNS